MSRPDPDANAERARMAALYRDLFETDRRGQEVFADLYKRFYAHAKVHTSGGIDAVLKTYEAASQKAVVQHIVNMINVASGADDAAEQPINGETDV
jgi:hypothetical protein